MKRLLAALGAVGVLATGSIVAPTPASAEPYYHGGYRHGGYEGRHYRHHRGGWDGGDALAAGVIGLGVGAIIGGALADSNRPVYYDDGPRYRSYGGDYYGGPILEGPVYERRVIEVERPVRYYREVPTYRRSGYNHVAACEARYRSYDRRSDTFVGYDGRVHRCRL